MLDCPCCGSQLTYRRPPGASGYIFYCRTCGLAHYTEGLLQEAYLKLIEDYERGEAAKATMEELLVKHRLVRSLSEVAELVRQQGLSLSSIPKPLRRILETRRDYVALYKLLEETEGEYGCSVEELPVHQAIKEGLKAIGIRRMYRFQEEAIKLILQGEDVVIAAPTGNGKTEAFAVPVYELILREPGRMPPFSAFQKRTRALFIYPTKALSRDQLEKLRRLGAQAGITASIFDGDTPQAERKRILEEPPDVLLTNLDILHYHMAHRTSLSYLLRDVQYVVVDELHEYTGAFGSNAYMILRRLERLAKSRIQYIGSSATVANPGEFASKLFNRRVEVVECRKGRRGRLHIVIIYPVLRRMYGMVTEILATLTSLGYKTLVFSNSHTDAEVIGQAALKAGVPCMVHRAGLKRSVRLRAEQAFKRGEVKAISATSTLELGIDIGDLDAVISAPVGITRFLQRLGRAGRKGQESIGVLALRENDPISSYYARHPEKYFRDIEPIYLEPRNPVVARVQLIAAAMDKPLSKEELPEHSHIARQLIEERLLVERRGKLYPTREGAKLVRRHNIRGIGETVDIYLEDAGRIGEREMPMAMRELFPGAVYLHGGEKYRSVSFTFHKGRGKAVVKPLPREYPYRTEALWLVYPEVQQTLEEREAWETRVEYCKLKITEVVEEYLVKEIYTGRTLERAPLDTPISYTYTTLGLVFTAPPIERSLKQAEEMTEYEKKAGAYHAIEHLLIEASDMLTGSGSRETAGVSMADTGVIFIYDPTPGGTGVTALLYQRFEQAVERALAVVQECDCSQLQGCPNCTHSYQCGSNNKPLYKPGAIEALEKMIRGHKTAPAEYRGVKPIV